MADFKANNTYKKFSKRSNFKEAIYEGRDLSQFASEMGFITPEDNSFVSSQSFNDLNEVAIRSTTNFYIVDDFIDEYFDDVDEFFETYNTGSFIGSFEGTITIKDVLVLPPLGELPNSPSPGSLVSLRDSERGSVLLYFYNGVEWILIT